MERSKKIIIVLLLIVLAILLFIVANAYFNQNVEYQSIYLSNATTIDVPVSDEAEFVSDDLGIKYYQDPKYDVSIISWNSQEELSIRGAADVAAQFEKQKGGNTPTIEDGVPIYYNSESGMYCIEAGNDTTHDNILIMCKDKDMALKIYHSIKFGISSINKDAGGSSINPPQLNTSETDDESDDSYYDDYDSYDDSGGSSNNRPKTNPSTPSTDDSSPDVETTTG